MSKGLQLFTCVNCHQTYLGHAPHPDCPYCGYEPPKQMGHRWDGLAYLLTILGILAFLLTASYYRGILGTGKGIPSIVSEPIPGQPYEKLPGSTRH